MKEQANVLRWGIPGWTAIIAFILFLLCDFIFAQDDRILQLINQLFSTTNITQTVLVGLLVAGAGVPVGYTIYQIYYYVRWNSPISGRGLLPPLVGGRDAELEPLTKRQKDKIWDITLNTGWRKELFEEQEKKGFRGYWYYLSPFLTEVFINYDTGKNALDRDRYLLDMLHSLGASYLGISISFIGYLILKTRSVSLGNIEGVVLFFVILFSFVSISIDEREGKDSVWGFEVTKYLSELFLISSVLLVTFLDPNINFPLNDFGAFVITILGMFLWYFFIDRNKIVFVWGTVCMFLGIFARLYLPIPMFSEINWSLLYSALLYNCLSLTFLKNRQNVRENLIQFQIYHIHNYVTKLITNGTDEEGVK